MLLHWTIPKFELYLEISLASLEPIKEGSEVSMSVTQHDLFKEKKEIFMSILILFDIYIELFPENPTILEKGDALEKWFVKIFGSRKSSEQSSSNNILQNIIDFEGF